MASFNSNAAIEAYYQGQKAPVNAQIETAGNDYQAALARLEQTKKAQDAENYRSYVRQQNELPGLMRASGNNGGMVDSAVASLANAYNQARANRAMEFENNRANQDLDYTNRLAQLRAQLAQYDQEANAAKAELAAQQAAAAARYRASQTPDASITDPVNRNKIQDNSFVKDYEANSPTKVAQKNSGAVKAIAAGINPYKQLGTSNYEIANNLYQNIPRQRKEQVEVPTFGQRMLNSLNNDVAW